MTMAALTYHPVLGILGKFENSPGGIPFYISFLGQATAYWFAKSN